MSRFTPARRAAIAVWTGASVVWATTATMAFLEPQRAGSADQSETATVSPAPSGGFPTMPASGLVVIRVPDSVDRSEPGTVPVTTAAPPPSPQPAADPAPRPVSAGS